MRNEDGTFGKGNSGRPKGSFNKSSQKVRLAFAKLLEDNLDTLKEDIEKLEPKDRAKFLSDLAKYIVPTLKSAEMNIKSDNKGTPIITFTSADKDK